MDENRVRKLLEKYNEDLCTDEEKALLETWYVRHETTQLSDLSSSMLETAVDRVWERLEITNAERTRVIRWRYLAAASILFILSVGGYFLLNKSQHEIQSGKNQLSDILPGRNQATLTLASGQKILIKKGLKGRLAQQGNTLIQVNTRNAITYVSGLANSKVEYNTLSTKKGEQSPYPLVLADGTKVWLNAASSITFPTAFNGHDRKVAVTGEAYFEVVHNAAKPFSVEAKNQTIEDIGTHFNINAYDDELSIKTTLLKGSILVSNGINKVILKPGQQSVLRNKSDYIKIEEADADAVLDWKNGLFIFNDESLESIMKKVSRWYNVDIIYQDIDSHKSFWGGVSRSDNVSELLRKLELTGGVHFNIEGRRIIVKK